MFFHPLFIALATFVAVSFNILGIHYTQRGQLLASREISLENRYEVKAVSDVFKDNILLNLAYLQGTVKNASEIDWTQLQKPFSFEVELLPSEVFAFHDDVLPEFGGKVAKTSNAHFNASEGFKSDGYLFGDGVCHLASLMNWVAKDAKLSVVAPASHDFAQIPQVPREFGVSIFRQPGQNISSQEQNLYITNALQNPVVFRFTYDGKDLKLEVFEDKKLDSAGIS